MVKPPTETEVPTWVHWCFIAVILPYWLWLAWLLWSRKYGRLAREFDLNIALPIANQVCPEAPKAVWWEICRQGYCWRRYSDDEINALLDKTLAAQLEKKAQRCS